MIHILAIVMVLIGVILTSVGVYNIVEGSKSKRWPTTIGTILKSEVKETRLEESVEYSTDIEYRYVVGGGTYLANRISWVLEGVTEPQKGEILQILKKYPLGQNVRVYYDPKAPNIATLNTAISFRAHLPWIIGVLLIASGFGLYYTGYIV